MPHGYKVIKIITDSGNQKNTSPGEAR